MFRYYEIKKKKKLNKDRSLFKRRGYSSILNFRRLRLRFGNYGIFFKQPTRVELIYLVMLRRILKRYRRKNRKIDVIHHRKFWFFLRRNHIISKKSKNARMGKGKGKFLRWCALAPRNYMLLEFSGWHLNVLKYVCYKMNRKASFKLGVFSQGNFRQNTVMGNPNYAYNVITRYNLRS